jgi:DNA primase large subunit
MAKKSILAYLFSRLAVSCLDDWVRRKYATKEARRYRRLIEKEDAARMKYLLGLISADFGIDFHLNNSVNVHVTSYLKASSRIKTEKWRLVNKDLSNGYVEITVKDYIRLIEEFLRERLAEKLNVSDEVKKAIEPYLRRIRPIIAKERKVGGIKFERADMSCFPPCMVKILTDLKNGVNVPHTARFAITSFLLNVGLGVEEVISLFRSAPDFSEEKTRYQVEHIAGAKGTEYDCPACDTMKTYNNCYADCKTYHPISYYERCMRQRTYKSNNRRR